MAKTKRYISVLIIPEDGSNTREYKVSSGIFRLIKGFSVVLFLVVVSAGMVYWRATYWAFTARKMEEENRLLRAENAKVLKLAQMVDEVRQSRQRLEVMLRGEAVPTGGTASPRSPILGSPGSDRSSEIRPTFRTVTVAQPTPPSPGGLERRPSIWPVEGRVSAPFGAQSGWIKQEYAGIAIAAGQNALVRAAADGQVTFAGWENALGMLMIVDHGGRYTTWYGHNERLLVDEEEWVKKGQAIALAGNTGKVSGTALHYEVWENGTPVDPEAFMLW
ncbi:MAG: M23 family metallopeptidase [Candidatus Latescibacterota bacterium]